jgi:hypothetical protein
MNPRFKRCPDHGIPYPEEARCPACIRNEPPRGPEGRLISDGFTENQAQFIAILIPVLLGVSFLCVLFSNVCRCK